MNKSTNTHINIIDLTKKHEQINVKMFIRFNPEHKILNTNPNLPNAERAITSRWQHGASVSVARTRRRILSQFTHLHPLYRSCFSRRRTRRGVTGKRRFVTEICPLTTGAPVVEPRQNSNPSHSMQRTRTRDLPPVCALPTVTYG